MGKEGVDKYEGVGFHTWQVKLKGMLMKKGLRGIIKPLSHNKTMTTWAQVVHFHTQDEKTLRLKITSLGDDYLHYINNAGTTIEA